MRTSWLSLVGMVVFTLLGGLSMTVVAQDQAPARPAHVIGTVVEQFAYTQDTGYSGQVEWQEDGVLQGRGALMKQVIDWSDPRLPATQWIRVDYTVFGQDDPESGVMTVATSHLLVGAEGSWRGTGRAIHDVDGRVSSVELAGDGAYAGLYALLRGTGSIGGPWDMSYGGYIFEGRLVAFPDPVEPLATEGLRVWPLPSGSPGR